MSFYIINQQQHWAEGTGAIQIVACVFHYDKILVINELRLENVLIMAYTSLYYSLIAVVPKS